MPPIVTMIIPAFNEAGVIGRTAAAVDNLFTKEGIGHLVLIVDDGSKDVTWQEIESLASQNAWVSGLRLSRNFGKEGAVFAGLAHAKTDCVIVMDGDLQHPPETALAMFRLWEKEDYDVVEAVKQKRQDESAVQRMGAFLFYALLKLLSGISLENMSDFKLLSRKAVDILNEMPERQTFFRAMAGWTGLRTGYVNFEAPPRVGGKTKFNHRALVKLAIDSISSYSSVPLQMVTLFGFGFTAFAVVMAVQTLYMKLTGRSVEGFTTVILLLLIIGGILMLSLGIIGTYIAKIYHEIKKRPRYIVGGKTKNL